MGGTEERGGAAIARSPFAKMFASRKGHGFLTSPGSTE